MARAAAAVVGGVPVAAAAVPRVPVVLRATAAEARGAQMRVGGVRVIDRAIRQLARLRDARVVIADDGSIAMPRLPRGFARRPIVGDAEAAIAALKIELGADTISIGADTVWLQPGRPDKGTRIVDRGSRKAVNDAIYLDLQRDSIGLIDRLINRRISLRLTRYLFAYLPLSPALLTLIAGFIALYGALTVATGVAQNVLIGFGLLEAYVVLDGCAAELARLRLNSGALAAWLETVVSDFVAIVTVLAVGLALWKHGGTYLDMKMAAVAAALMLFGAVVSYTELKRQGEADVMKLRWWFAYAQAPRNLTGTGSRSIKLLLLLGRRDVVFFLGFALAWFDQLPVVLLCMLIIGIVRAGAALGQLTTTDWRIRPQP